MFFLIGERFHVLASQKWILKIKCNEQQKFYVTMIKKLPQ